MAIKTAVTDNHPHLKSYLEETLEAWRDARIGIIKELENIPEDRLDFRPTPETRSVRELIQHILEVSMMMTGELSRPYTNMKRAPWPDLLNQYAKAAYGAKTKRELLDILSSQMDDAERSFRKAGDLALWQFMDRFDGLPGTKMQWLHHGISQEMYHRGQLTIYARLMGLVPALTQRIHGT
jgi:uncharacterized damage-inducible protein DinB